MGFISGKILEQTSWQVFGKIITSLSTILILAFVTRNYGESGTGLFTMVLTYLAFFYLAADFGINAHVLKKIQIEFRKLLGFRILWGLTLSLIAILVAPLMPFNNILFYQSVQFGAAAIIGYGVFITTNAIFQSRLRYDLSVISAVVGVLVSSGIILWGVLNHLPAPFLISAHSIGWVLTAVLSLILARRFVSKLWPLIDFSFIRSTVIEAWPISLSLVLNVVYFRVDSYLLAIFKSFADVGIYNLSYQVFQSALVLPTFIMNAYYPQMLDVFKNIKLFKSTLVSAGILLLSLSLIGCVATILISPLLINILTGGSGFAGSAISLQILALSLPAYFLSSLLMWTLVTVKMYKQMLAIYGIGLFVNVALNILLIPRYSFLAAASVTGISEYLILLLQGVTLFKWWRR